MIPGSAHPLLMKPAADDEVVTKSCRFDGGSHLSRTPSSTGDRETWTLSFWAKLGDLSSEQYFFSADTSGATECFLRYNTDNTLLFQIDGGSTAGLSTTAKFRDPSAWYHFTIIVDTKEASSSDRVKLYINTVEQSLSGTYPSTQYDDTSVNLSGTPMQLGRRASTSGSYYEGLLADVYLVDGAAVTPKSNFTNDPASDANGQLKPKAYTGSLGTNGFHLDFQDNGSSGSNLGNDAAGSNNFTTSGIAAHDQLNDTPTNNFCTFNPLRNGSGVTLAEGNLRSYDTSIPYGSSAAAQRYLNWHLKTGTWLIEFRLGSYNYSQTGANNNGFEFQRADDSSEYCAFYDGSTTVSGGSLSASGSAGDWSAGDIIGLAVDFDSATKTVKCYKNGTLTSTVSGFSANEFFVLNRIWGSGYGGSESWLNCGQDPTFAGTHTTTESEFAHPISGYSALSTANLPTPTIAKGDEHFNTIIWTGDGDNPETHTVGFQPDLVWAKARPTTHSHRLVDSLRGAHKVLYSDTASNEYPDDTGGDVSTFVSTGFTTSGTSNNDNLNMSGRDFVAWNWKAGTASGSDEKYNADAGFSIIKWEGNSGSNSSGERTISHYNHGGTAMIIAKSRTSNATTDYMAYENNWVVWHKSLSSNEFLTLDTNSAKDSWSTSSDDVISSVSASSFKVGNGAAYSSGNNFALNYDGTGLGMSEDSDDYICYLFSEVAGFSKFGSYIGNGVSDGPMVWTNHQPAWLLIRRADSTGDDWTIYDDVRSPYNAVDEIFYANTSGSESENDTSHAVDFLSNGFKCRGTSTQENASGVKYVFASFAKKPFVYANGK